MAVLAAAGFAAVAPGTANADMCNDDFYNLAAYYYSIGDMATGNALWNNGLKACFYPSE